MLAAAANATATPAPASLHRFTMTSDGWLFADSARDSDAVGSRVISFQENHFGSPWLTALSGVELLVANAPRRGGLVTLPAAWPKAARLHPARCSN